MALGSTLSHPSFSIKKKKWPIFGTEQLFQFASYQNLRCLIKYLYIYIFFLSHTPWMNKLSWEVFLFHMMLSGTIIILGLRKVIQDGLLIYLTHCWRELGVGSPLFCGLKPSISPCIFNSPFSLSYLTQSL